MTISWRSFVFVLASVGGNAAAQAPEAGVSAAVSGQCDLANLDPLPRFGVTAQESVVAGIRQASTCIKQNDAACADTAIASVQDLTVNDEERALLAISRAELATLRKDSAAAVEVYRRALLSSEIGDSLRRELTWRLAAVLNARSEFSEALRLLGSIACDQWTAEALGLRAVAYQGIGARDFALEQYEAAMKLYELEGRAVPAALTKYRETLLATEMREPLPGTDIVPVFLQNPDYPPNALRRGISGWVQLRFDITDNGTVENVRVAVSTHEIFEEPSIAVVQRWRYVPKLENGLPLRRDGEQTVIEFCLEPCRWRDNPPPKRGPDGLYPDPPAAP